MNLIISTKLKTALGSISISNFLLGLEFVLKVWDKLGKFFSLVFCPEVSSLLLSTNLGWILLDDSIFISGDFVLFFLLLFIFFSFSFLILLILLLSLSLILLLSFLSFCPSFILLLLLLFSSLNFFEKIFSALLSVFSNFFLSSSNSLVFNTKLLLFFFSELFFSFVMIF